jgi:hypothetical protein
MLDPQGVCDESQVVLESSHDKRMPQDGNSSLGFSRSKFYSTSFIYEVHTGMTFPFIERLPTFYDDSPGTVY